MIHAGTFRPTAPAWLRRIARKPAAVIGFLLVMLCVFGAVCASAIWPVDPLQQDILNTLSPPGAGHPLGTDAFGRDVLSRVLHAAQISMWVGVASITIALTVGSAIGIVSGYVGGKVDTCINGLLDVLLTFPTLLLGLMVVAMLGPSMSNLIFAIALTELAPFARIARAPTMALKDREFVDAARSLGFSNLRIIANHILPNLTNEIVVVTSLWLATAIRTEAALSFIGLGVKPPTATWGSMIREGFDNILDAPWIVLAPSIAILILVLGLSLLGDGLRDALDARSNRE
jgi:peptide/nickel transport system permease protein